MYINIGLCLAYDYFTLCLIYDQVSNQLNWTVFSQ